MNSGRHISLLRYVHLAALPVGFWIALVAAALDWDWAFVLVAGAAFISLGCGIALVHVHRVDRLFLPLEWLASYSVAVGGSTFMTMALLHDHVGLHHVAYLAIVLVPLLAFIVPWLLWRRDKPTPIFVDAALLSLVALLAYDAGYYLRYGDVRPEPWYIWFIGGEFISIWGVAAIIALIVLFLGRRARAANVISVALLIFIRAALFPI